MAEALRKWWLPGWLFTLYFIYPIPHTIALRNLLLIAGLGTCLWLVSRNENWKSALPPLKAFRVSGWFLLSLTLWLLIQSSFISPYPRLALDHWRGDWLNELLVMAIGGCAVLTCQNKGINRPLVAMILALFSHIVLLLGYQSWQWASTGSYPFGTTPFAQRDYHSMLVTTLIALLLADLVTRSTSKNNNAGSKPPPLVPLSMVLAMLALSLLATVTLLARNAVIITILMLVVSIGIFAFVGTKRIGNKTLPAVIALLAVSSVVSWTALQSDTRWQGFSEAAAVAFDTQNNLAWLDAEKYPRPRMQNGQPVEESAYMRLAWAKVALEQIARYPLGLGYGHQAFGWAVNRSYNLQTGHESSHSGLLDFTLANGIPGLVLWLVLSGALIITGWRAFRKDGSSAGLMLAFTVVAYFVRCLVDGHISGFRLEMYALLVGVLIMTQTCESERCK